MRAHHPIRATHRVANSPRALVIQMILPQQPQQFAPIGFQIGLDVTVRLVADHLGAQMVRDRDKLLIGAMKRLVNRDNLCFHRFGPLVARVERIKCLIYPLRGLFSSIIRYNVLISFNSVSLRKSHTRLGTPSGRVAGEVRGLVPPWAGAEARDGEALKSATTRLRGVPRGGRQASTSSVRLQDGGSATWPASRAEAVTS